MEWGDFDLDGDLDLLVAGATTDGTYTAVFSNDEGIFSEYVADLPGVDHG